MEQSFCFLHVFGSEKQERKEAHAHTDTVWFRLHLRDQIKMGLQIQGKDHIMTKKIKSSLWTAGMLILFGVMLSLTRYGDSSAAEMTSGSVRSSSSHNPIMDHKFGADPFAMTYNGRVYVYMTNDSHCYDQTPKDANGKPLAANKYSTISTITVVSSSDLVNWVDHGEIDVSKITSWAKNSWAPSACWKRINGKDKFFLYFADNANGIGVLQADSPIGPFKEPSTGSRLITRGSQAAQGVEWLFDPAVLVDDDGKGYLYYGGGIPGDTNASQQQKNYPGTARVVRLADNMVQLAGNATAINAPGIFEDSGIHKKNGKYYYTYCSNFSNNLSFTGNGNICVMESNNPMGPFTYAGIVYENPYVYFGIGGNNHHAFFDFNGKTYLTYHAQTVTKALQFPANSQGYRSTHIDPVSYDANGHIKPVKGTYQGVPQTKNLDPYVRNEAETIGWSSGLKTSFTWEPGSIISSSNMKVSHIHNGDWLAVSKADLNTGLKAITFHASPVNGGGTIEVRLDSRYGTKLGEVSISGNPSTWKDYSASLSSATGVHDLYFVFKGSSTGELFYLDHWNMSENNTTTPDTSAPAAGELVKNGGIEDGTTGWSSLYGAKLDLGYVTIHSGKLSLKASGRTMTAAGAVQDMTGRFEKGKTYDVSAALRFNSSENPKATGKTQFFISIIYRDGKIENMATVTTAADQWAVMNGTYTVPANADLSQVRVFVETAYRSTPGDQDLVTFFVDDISIRKSAGQTAPASGGTLPDGWYYIQNTNAGKYLQTADSTGNNGVNVEIGTGNGSAAQKWYVTNTGNGYVTIKNGLGAMLDVQYGENKDGANIQTYSANGADAQLFQLQKTTASNVYGITTKISKDARSLDVYNFGKSDGTNVCQWQYNASSNQTWIFEPCR